MCKSKSSVYLKASSNTSYGTMTDYDSLTQIRIATATIRRTITAFYTSR